MRNNWECKRLSDLCEINPPKKEARVLLGGDDLVSFVPMEDLGILTKSFTAHKQMKLKQVVGSYTYFSENDVLLAKITPCFENGKIGIAGNLKNGVGFGSSEYIVCRSLGKLLPEYLFYFLVRDQFRSDGKKVMTGAVGHKRVPKDFIKNQLIPYPKSISEQKRIVAILDKAFAAIDKAKENTEKNLQDAKELFESYLQGIFSNFGEGWERKKLGQVCEIIMGQSPDGSTYNTTGSGTPLINGPVEFGRGDFYKTIKSKFTTAPTKLCKKDDLILCVRGSTTGRTNIAGFDACIGRGVAAIRYEKNQIWINYYIRSLKKKIYQLGTGSTFPNVSGSILANLLIPLPSLDVQDSIISKLERLSSEVKKLELIYQNKMSLLNDFKKSILQKAFNGELTATQPDIIKEKAVV